MIVKSCGYLYIIFTLMLGLGTNFGVFGRYIICLNALVYDLKKCPIKGL